jgi:hypothetical protein
VDVAPARWRDQRGLSIALVVVFGVMAVAATLLVVALANRLSVVHDFQDRNFTNAIQRADDADDFVGGASAFYAITYLAIIVLFVIWMFRAAKNNEALERRNPRFGPGWSIGSWFIPFANFVIPVLIMQDLWRGATPTVPRGDPNWRRAAGSWLVALWWTAWLLTFLRFGGRDAAFSENTSLSDIETNNTFALVGAVVTVVAAVLAGFVVWKLSRRQLETLRTQRAAYDGVP